MYRARSTIAVELIVEAHVGGQADETLTIVQKQLWRLELAFLLQALYELLIGIAAGDNVEAHHGVLQPRTS